MIFTITYALYFLGSIDVLDGGFPWPRTRPSWSKGICQRSTERNQIVSMNSLRPTAASYALVDFLRPEDHAEHESLERNRISNVAFAVCSTGEIIILAVMVGILKALKSDESTENNTRAFSVLIAFSGGVWCMYHPFLL